jgi:hypothetical protein
MAKSRDISREDKKKPATTTKEKRAARKAKKGAKTLLGNGSAQPGR